MCCPVNNCNQTYYKEGHLRNHLTLVHDINRQEAVAMATNAQNDAIEVSINKRIGLEKKTQLETDIEAITESLLECSIISCM